MEDVPVHFQPGLLGNPLDVLGALHARLVPGLCQRLSKESRDQ